MKAEEAKRTTKEAIMWSRDLDLIACMSLGLLETREICDKLDTVIRVYILVSS